MNKGDSSCPKKDLGGVPAELQSNISLKLQSLVKKANQFYGRRMPVPKLCYELSGATAGQLIIESVTRSRKLYTVRLNGRMAAHFPDQFLQEILPHEVAHLVVDWIYGRRVKPHGKEWCEVMVQCFECAPKRCHDIPVQMARQHPRNHLYLCGCQEHYFTNRRHRSAVRGATYLCNSCREQLVYQTTLVS